MKSSRRDSRRRDRRLLFEGLEDRRLLNVDWRNPGDSLDVTKDGEITPNDVLGLINDINGHGARPLAGSPAPQDAYLDPSGDGSLTPVDVLMVINHLNAFGSGPRAVSESGVLADEELLTITVGGTSGSGVRTLQLQIDAAFDTSAASALEDVFSVYVVDPDQPSATLLDRGQPGTAVFALSGVKAEFVPGLVHWDGRTLELDLSSLGTIDTARLKLQLLNSDGDRQSRVTVRPISNEVNTEASPGPQFTQPTDAAAPGSPLDVASLPARTDVQVQVENVRFDSGTGHYRADVRLLADQNPLGRTAALVLPGLPAGVSLANASGTTGTGSPYLSLAPGLPRGGLGAGMLSDAIRIELQVVGNRAFTLAPQVVAADNRPPDFSPLAPLTVLPGGRIEHTLGVTDPDGDQVTYSLRSDVALPNGTLGGNGTLVFTPSPGQVGAYAFTVVASDGALETAQPVRLNVNADPLTTTRVSGFVLDVDQTPLAGMQVEIGAIQGLTQADGSFLLDLGNGPVVSDTLKIRGELFQPSGQYPFIAEKLELMLEHAVYSQVNNAIGRPIYLPQLDAANAWEIDPNQDTTVSTGALPGVSLFVAAGTLMNQQGTPFTGKLSITEVPVDLTPAAVPEDLKPDLVVTIQPGDMAFASPAPMTFPNTGGWPAGMLMDLWSINPVTGQFDDVGDMRVSSAGSLVETISGGVRNSSWHLLAPPPDPPPPPEYVAGPDSLPQNQDEGEPCEPGECRITSQVQLHSGGLTETHDLVAYRSLGQTRGFQLVYDSLRADPRPIRQFGVFNPRVAPDSLFMATMTIDLGGFVYQVPGYSGTERGLTGGENFWTPIPASFTAALQADLRTVPTGRYDYQVRQGIVRFDGDRYTGRLNRTGGDLVHVNAIDSPFGSGWGLAGLQELVVNADRSVLLVDGDGRQILFEPGATPEEFVSPEGDFSTLVRLPDGTFRRTLSDQTVVSFNSANRIAGTRDPHGNTTVFAYDGIHRLTQVTDPAGLVTTFAYSGGRASTITDPAGRVTRLIHDAAGNLLQVVDPDGATRAWEYDALHHMTGETDPRGQRERTFYDAAGRVTRAIRKDGTTIAVTPTQVQGLATAKQGHDFTHPAAVTAFGPAQARYTDVRGNPFLAELDRRGQITGAADVLGALPATARGGGNLVSSITEASGSVTQLRYDDRGNLTALERPSDVQPGAISGTIDHPGEKDTYAFEATAGQRVYGLGTRDGIPTRATLVGPNGQVIDEFSTSFGMSRPRTLPETGTYALEVGLTGFASPVSYSFRLLDLSNVPSLGLGQAAQTSLFGDRAFRFTGRRGQRLSVTLFDDPSGAPVFTMHGPDGSQVALGTTALVPGTLPVDGDYALTILPGNNFGFASFRFQLNEQSESPVSPSGFGTLHSAQLAFGETLDVPLTVPAGLPILIDSRVQSYGFGAEARFELLANAGNDPSQVTAVNTGFPMLLPASGNYTARLTGERSDAEASVQLRILNLDAVPTLSLSAPIDATLDPQALHLYRFDATAGQRLLLFTSETSATIYRNTSGVLRSTTDDREPFTVPDTGTYYVAVASYSAAARDYRVELRDATNLPPLPLDTEIAVHLEPDSFPYAREFTGQAGDRFYFDDRGSSAVAGAWKITFAPHDLTDNFFATSCGSYYFGVDTVCTLPRTGTYQFVATARGFGDVAEPLDARFALIKGRHTTTLPVFEQVTTGAITRPLESFDYAFYGTAGQRVFYDGRGSETRVSAKLISPLGAERFRLAAHSDSNWVTLAETGTYRLHLSEDSGRLGSFSFRLLDLENAESLTLGVEASGQGLPEDAIKVFRINGTRGQRLHIGSPGPSIPETRWYLYGPGNHGVTYGYLSGNGTGFDANLPTDGTYVLASGGALSGGAFDYRIVVTDVSDAPVTPAGLGVPIAGEVADGETDTFAFAASAGSLVFYDELQDDLSRLLVCLRDPFGNQLACYHEGVRDGDPLLLPQSGQYTVSVTGGADDYAFRIVDLRAAAAPITVGQLVTGTVPRSDFAVFRYNATFGQRLYVDNQADAQGVIRTFGPDGRLVFEGLFGGFTRDDDVKFVVPESGEYFARVDFTGDAPQAGYRFRILDADQAPWLALDTTVTGNFDDSGMDAIPFRVSGTGGGKLAFEDLLNGSPRPLLGYTSPHWSVYDANWQRLDGVSDDSVVAFAHDGTYYLVNDSDVVRTGPFALRVLEPPVSTRAIDLGPPAARYTYDATFNELTSRTDELGRQVRYEVDPANGSRLSLTQVVGAVGGLDDLVTRYTYTPQGLLKTVTDPLGHVIEYDYDARGRLIGITEAAGTPAAGAIQFEYDDAGNLTAIVDPNGHRTESFYDAAGRLMRNRDALGNETRYAYDPGGLLISVTDARGNVSRAEYDALGRLVRSIDAAGNSSRFTYDAAGNLTSTTDPLGHTTAHRYDARNRLIETLDAAGGRTQFSYDADDNLTRVVDPLGNATEFDYDSRSRLVRRADPRQNSTTFSYDLADQLVSQTDRNGRTIQFAYDDLGRVVSEAWVGGNHVVTYAYDAAGQLLAASDPSGTLAYTYDARGRTTRVATSGPAGRPDTVLDYVYDAAGNLLAVTDTIGGGAQGTNSYLYDALDRVSRIVQTGAGINEKRVDFTYDPLGAFDTISRFSDAAGAAPVARSTFAYDTLNRVTNIAHQNAANTLLNAFSFVYDAASRITQITDIDGATDFTYSTVDELLGAAHADPANPDESYRFDANGNRTSSHLPGAMYVTDTGNRVTSDGTFQYEYDAEGNLIRRTTIASGAVREFTWDHRDRLVTVIDYASLGGPATQIVRYVYDAFDRRIGVEVDAPPGDGQAGAVTYFVYDGDDVLVELVDPDGSGPLPAAESLRYLHGPAVDQVLAREDAAGNVLWQLADHLGTVRDLVRDDGSLADHLRYDSFGNAIADANPAVASRYRFTGREFDLETGLHYYRARYYDASTGRFISEDPIGFDSGDANLFRYVHNDPLHARDPSGLTRQKTDPTQTTVNAGIKKTTGIDVIGNASAYEGAAQDAHGGRVLSSKDPNDEGFNQLMNQVNDVPVSNSPAGPGGCSARPRRRFKFKPVLQMSEPPSLLEKLRLRLSEEGRKTLRDYDAATKNLQKNIAKADGMSRANTFSRPVRKG
jgi:RHS repeat-associated protein